MLFNDEVDDSVPFLEGAGVAVLIAVRVGDAEMEADLLRTGDVVRRGLADNAAVTHAPVTQTSAASVQSADVVHVLLAVHTPFTQYASEVEQPEFAEHAVSTRDAGRGGPFATAAEVQSRKRTAGRRSPITAVSQRFGASKKKPSSRVVSGGPQG